MKPVPKIVILGPQGSGKGTQAGFLARHFKIPHISAGDLLREEKATNSRLGRRIATIIDRGGMMPDSVMSAIIGKRLRQADAKRGWILDGYPRFIEQYRTFNSFAKPNIAILLDLPDQFVTDRLSGRRSCPRGHVYHLLFHRPRRRGHCDFDDLALKCRTDDTPTAIKKRLRLYHRKTEPIAAIYRRQKILLTADARPPIKTVYRQLVKALTAKSWLPSPRRKK